MLNILFVFLPRDLIRQPFSLICLLPQDLLDHPRYRDIRKKLFSNLKVIKTYLQSSVQQNTQTVWQLYLLNPNVAGA